MAEHTVDLLSKDAIPGIDNATVGQSFGSDPGEEGTVVQQGSFAFTWRDDRGPDAFYEV